MVTIAPQATVYVQPGVSVYLYYSTLSVQGVLHATGTEAAPITLSSDQQSSIEAKGGTLDFDWVNMAGGKKVIDAFSSSTVSIGHATILNVSTNQPAISVWNNSSIRITDSTLKNIQAPYSVEVFNGSTLSISNSTFDNAGQNAEMSVYGSLNGQLSGGTITNSRFTNAILGIETFNGSRLQVSNSVFDSQQSSALQAFSGADLTVTNSQFSNNEIGVEAYNSSTTISQSLLEHNRSYGAYSAGGTFNSTNNWWGDGSGPFNAAFDPEGKGDAIESNSSPYPWLTWRPDMSPCCSSVLFVPGIEGSRLYARLASGSAKGKQLWEPSSNADVKKLFLKANGDPVSTSIYSKDIILKTNIGFGLFDKQVYGGAGDFLDGLVSSGVIHEWKPFAYDWRLDPDKILQGVQRSDKSLDKMEDDVKTMAKNSLSKKVTIVAHSYGGLLTKRLLEKLKDDGEDSLVDKVVLVATPEEGTISTITALLHGDDQEIGDGYVLDAATARQLSLNMPSAYYLLPDPDLLASLSDIPVVRFSTKRWFGDDVKNISTENALTDFMTDKGDQRPSPSKATDVQLPAKANDSLYAAAMRKKNTYDDLNASLLASTSIAFYNIVGSGIKTLRAVSYVDKGCGALDSIDPLVNKDYCGFDHVPIFSNDGDGTVLEGDMSKRLGLKIIFNEGLYNVINQTNYQHADIVSAPPVIDALRSIITNQPPSRIGSDYATVDLADSDASGTNREDDQAFDISSRDGSLLTIEDKDGRITGLSSFSEATTSLSLMAIDSEIPNSIYYEIGDTRHVVLDELPYNIKVKSTKTGKITVKVAKKNVNSTATDTTSFSFDDVPVVSGTTITVTVHSGSGAIISGSSGDGSQAAPISASSTYTAIGTIDYDNDGVADRIISDPISGGYLVLGTSTVSIDGGLVDGTGGATGTSTATSGDSSDASSTASSGATPTFSGADLRQYPSPLDALALIRMHVASSTVANAFKQRYLLKIGASERRFVKNGLDLSLPYVQLTVASLTAIVADLARVQARYYKGGMMYREAAFLYSEFTDLLGAFSFARLH